MAEHRPAGDASFTDIDTDSKQVHICQEASPVASLNEDVQTKARPTVDMLDLVIFKP